MASVFLQFPIIPHIVLVLIYQLIKLFNGAGYSVYLDWINDPESDRGHVTDLTAQLLRKRMRFFLPGNRKQSGKGKL